MLSEVDGPSCCSCTTCSGEVDKIQHRGISTVMDHSVNHHHLMSQRRF